MGPYPYLTVLIPVYNEEKNIASTVKIISDKLVSLNCTFEILIVDDCSTDQTLNIIKKLMVSNLAIRLYQHSKNRGPGTGIVTGITNSRGQFIIFIPADLAMDIDCLSSFLEASKNADVIVGLRSDRRDYGLFRKLISITNILTIKLLFAMPYEQFNYIGMYRRTLFQQIKLESQSVFVGAEIMIKARDLGLNISQIRVTYVPRRYGKARGSSFRSIKATLQDMFKIWIKWMYQTSTVKN